MIKYPKLAIIYDFDGTLAKGNIQENFFIPELGIEKEKFWNSVKQLAEDHKMDEILAYMYQLIKMANEKNVKINRENIKRHGNIIQYFSGVKEFFGEINKVGKENKVNIEHYIISSGTKEMIEGTDIAKHFTRIYASTFMYEQHGVPIWPALAINYTTKTQYLFRINKGIEDSHKHDQINKYVEKKNRPIPFEQMIYLGDGETDIPAMRLVKDQGGVSIAVYEKGKKKAKARADGLLKDGRVNYIAEADFSKEKTIFKIITAIIKMINEKSKISRYARSMNESKNDSDISNTKKIAIGGQYQAPNRKKSELKLIASEIKVYTEDDHRQKTSEEVFELYEQFRDAILNLTNDIEIKPQKLYIAFKKDGNIACIALLKKGLKIFIDVSAGQLDDPKALAKDVSQIGHWGTGIMKYRWIMIKTLNIL